MKRNLIKFFIVSFLLINFALLHAQAIVHADNITNVLRKYNVGIEQVNTEVLEKELTRAISEFTRIENNYREKQALIHTVELTTRIMQNNMQSNDINAASLNMQRKEDYLTALVNVDADLEKIFEAEKFYREAQSHLGMVLDMSGIMASRIESLGIYSEFLPETNFHDVEQAANDLRIARNRLTGARNLADISVRTDYPRDTVLGATFQNVQLPSAIANQDVVQIKLWVNGDVRAGGNELLPNSGNTSINNIVFKGDSIIPFHCDYCENSGDCCEHCNPCKCNNVELASLNAPGMSFSLPPIANFAEAVALLPQYAAITTNPPTVRDTLPIKWEIVLGFDFNPSLGAFNFVQWSVTLPQDISNSARIPISDFVMVLIVDGELGRAEAAARRIAVNLPVSNATTAIDFIVAVEAAIDNPAIMVTWFEEFEITHATQANFGTITGVIRLVLDDKYMDVTLNRWWSHPLISRYNAAQLAINNLDVSNGTTATDFIKAVETVVVDTGIKVSFINFNLIPATTNLQGAITGTICLTYGC